MRQTVNLRIVGSSPTWPANFKIGKMVKNISKDKKTDQLGMNPGTATHRLVKDILWKFIEDSGLVKCFRCSEDMTRDDFSIDHIEPWLDSDNPIELFFDVKNIAYSHLSCNSKAARRKLSDHGTTNSFAKGCRCELCTKSKAESRKRHYSYKKRREKYLNNGT